jgi:hypothetical protein
MKLKEMWRTSVLFRRATALSVFALTALLVYLGSNIPRSVSLPADDLNTRSVAQVGEQQIVLEKPDIAEGDLALSYVGNKNEIADLWLDHATLDDRTQHLLFPASTAPQPERISYTTNGSAKSGKSNETCHTTIEIRRSKGSVPIESLKLYQSDATAGPQRFRQVVLEAGETAMEIEVHTDSPSPTAMDLPGCHKLLTLGDAKPVDVPPIPLRLIVTGGKINLHFNPANPELPIWTGQGQTFEAVSVGDGVLRGHGLQIISIEKNKAVPALNVRAESSDRNITFSRLKLGSDMLRIDIGRDPEKARAYADGSSMYTYDLIAGIQKNPILSFALGVVLVPALWKWVRKNCFPNLPD